MSGIKAGSGVNDGASTEGWLDELRSAYLYRIVAAAEAGTPREALFNSLALEAEGQARIWADRNNAGQLPAFVPDVRTRVVADRKSTRLNSSHSQQSRMPSSA